MVDILLNWCIIPNVLHIRSADQIAARHGIQILFNILDITQNFLTHFVQELVQSTNFILTGIAEFLRHMALCQLIDAAFQCRQGLYHPFFKRIRHPFEHQINCGNEGQQQNVENPRHHIHHGLGRIHHGIGLVKLSLTDFQQMGWIL